MRSSTALIVRGILSLIIGILAILWPGITLVALVALFAAYAFLDGVANLVQGFQRTAVHDRSWSRVLLGVIGVAAGTIALLWPQLTLLWLVLFIAAWAIVRGVLDLVAAVQLRHEIRGEWLLALAGAISILFGVLVFLFPAAGALTVAWLLGIYAAAIGVVLIALGIRLRQLRPA